MQPIDRYAKAKAAPADSQPPQDQRQVLDEQSERSIGGRSPHNEAMSASQESMSRNGTADYDTSYDTTKLDTATSRGWDEPRKDFWTRVYASSKRQSCQIRQQWRDMAYDTYVQGRNLNKAAAEAEYQDTTSSHPSSTYTAASDGPQEQRNHDAARTSGSAFFKPWDPQSKHHFARYMADAEQLPLEEGLKSMNDRVSNYVGRRLEVEAKSAFEHAQSTAHSVRESQHSRDRYLGRTQQEWFQLLLQRSKDAKRRKSGSRKIWEWDTDVQNSNPNPPEVDVIGSPPDRDNSISFRDRTEGSGAKIVEIKFRGDWTTIMSSRYSLAELGKLTAPPTANDASLSIKPPGDHAPTPSTAVRFSSRIPRPSAGFFSRETWPPSQTDPVSEQSTSEAVQSTPESSPCECNRYGATSAPPTPTHQGYHESMSRASWQSSRASTNSETALVYPDPEESPISLSMFPQRLSPKISTSYQSHQTSSPSRPPQPPAYESLGDNDCNAQTILTGDNTALFGRAGAGGWQIYNKRWFGADAVLNGETRRERLTSTVFSEWPTEIWTNAPHSANFELSTAGSEVPPAYSKVEGPSEGKSRLSKITSGFSLHVKSKLPTHIRHFPHAASTYLQDRALRRVKSTSPVSVDPTSHLTNGGAKYSSSEPPVCFATIRPDLKDYSDSIPNDEFYDDSRDAEQDGRHDSRGLP